ncbi:uncharacterized protein [Miscanthus floridulus]|uniref:uncharacterized protein n=1 Tax=Miscanthus floridulus TaxID=154761 RepID=UPI003459E6AA
MASGSGKNQDDTKTKELVDLLSKKKSNAASSTTEPSPAAPPFKSLQEQCHGPLEAGGRDSSTATAAAAEWKGEETMALSRRRSVGGKPPLPPCPASILRARGANIEMKDLINEQKRNEDATCGVRISGRRRINGRRIFLVIILIFFGNLPTAIGFQRYDLDAAANELRAPGYQMQIQQALAAQEAHEAARLKVLWRTAAAVLFLAFLFGSIMAGPNNGQEEVMPPEAPAPEIGRGSDLLIVVLILFALVMVTVALRVGGVTGALILVPSKSVVTNVDILVIVVSSLMGDFTT